MKWNKKYNLTFFITGILIAFVVLNMLLVYAESKNPESGIKTFHDAVWYMIITLTTVGYGDLYPTTPLGKAVGYIFVFGSLGTLGYLISTLTSKYHTMMEEKKLGYRGTDFENHIIFIGWDDFSRMVAEEIFHSSKKIAIVTKKKDQIDLIYAQFGKENTFVLFADYANLDLLVKANVEQAAAVFINLPDDAQVLLYVIDFKKRYPHPQIVVSIDNSRLKDTFLAAGVTYAIARNEIASKMVASYMFEPDVANLNSDLISSSRTVSDYDMQEYKVLENNRYAGMNYFDAFLDMKKTRNAVLVGLSRKKDGNWIVLTNPQEETIQAGDYMILMCSGGAKRELKETFGVEEGRVLE